MRRGRVSLHSVLRAFDEAAFGSTNTLNLRESLPTAADARFRVEAWLRERQISRATEVLIITGRGNQSPGGVSPVREAILALMPSLRRRGVVAEWREHSPGSFVIKPGSISTLLEAPRRRRDRVPTAAPPNPELLKGLERPTIELLRRLAIRSLESLGVREPEKFVEAEMLSKFNSLVGTLKPGAESEARLRETINAALEQLDE
ncbi:MAG: Smr/MutS family protein [Gemmatimonadaceae bacterium]